MDEDRVFKMDLITDKICMKNISNRTITIYETIVKELKNIDEYGVLYSSGGILKGTELKKTSKWANCAGENIRRDLKACW